MNKKKVTLPDRDEMLKRLLKVSSDPHAQNRFYPILLQSAGQELVAHGVVMMIVLAIYDYTNNMSPAMSNLMYMQAPRIIEALVDDEEIATEAKSFLEEILPANK
jgi:uncharacterized membrane-anchored protein YjiN (DUF445 family)